MKVAVLCQERRHSLRHWPNSPFIPRRNFAPSFRSSDVRFGSEADILHRLADVRFTPKSGHWSLVANVRFVPKADICSAQKDVLIRSPRRRGQAMAAAPRDDPTSRECASDLSPQL